MTSKVEEVARAIAEAIFREEVCDGWVDDPDKGHLEEFVIDGPVDLYAVARAAIEAMREPSEEMWDAGRSPIMHRDVRSPPKYVVCEPWFNAAVDKPPRDDGHAPKGDTAVWTWRAMIDAALTEPQPS